MDTAPGRDADIPQTDADALQRLIDAIAREVARHVQPKEWMSLKTLASHYADISERKLREFLGHPTHPLPARLVGGKWLISRSEFDRWARQFPAAGENVDRLVDSIMKGIQDD